MKLLHKAHYSAVMDLVELMSIAGWVAIFADCIWVLRDSVVNGFTPIMVFILTLLCLSLVTLTLALYTYHNRKYKEHLKQLMIDNLKLCKKKFIHRGQQCKH